MEMGKQVEKIREEIVRRITLIDEACQGVIVSKITQVEYKLLEELLSFINSLQEEPVSEELEEFAEEQDESLYRSDAVIAGAKWKEEQMMKKAIEREVKVDAGGYPYIDATEFYDYENDKPLAKAGDKIKVVFMKE